MSFTTKIFVKVSVNGTRWKPPSPSHFLTVKLTNAVLGWTLAGSFFDMYVLLYVVALVTLMSLKGPPPLIVLMPPLLPFPVDVRAYPEIPVARSLAAK